MRFKEWEYAMIAFKREEKIRPDLETNQKEKVRELRKKSKIHLYSWLSWTNKRDISLKFAILEKDVFLFTKVRFKVHFPNNIIKTSLKIRHLNSAPPS